MLGEGENNRLQADETIKYGDFFLPSYTPISLAFTSLQPHSYHYIHQRKLMKTLTQYSFLALCLFLMGSCGTAKLASSSYAPAPIQENRDYLTQSLFSSKDKTISEEGIAKILDSDIKLPDTIRLAILNYASNSINRYYSAYWSNEEFLKLQQSFIEIFKKKLSANSKVKQIILMPKLMIGSNPNIFTLRESAVRLQADLFLVFSINSDIYYKYKTFKKDEAKAYATAEALLMDVRTGIIPFSDIVTRENQVTKDNNIDLSNQDTQKRAENGAIQSTLEELSTRVNDFLKQGK